MTDTLFEYDFFRSITRTRKKNNQLTNWKIMFGMCFIVIMQSSMLFF